MQKAELHASLSTRFSTMKIKGICSSETSMDFHRITLRRILEYRTPDILISCWKLSRGALCFITTSLWRSQLKKKKLSCLLENLAIPQLEVDEIYFLARQNTASLQLHFP